MSIKSEIWGRIRYIVFLALFVSLIAVYWTYSYEVTLNPEGLQERVYPYRNYSILFVMISIMLFAVYVYASIKKEGDQAPSSSLHDR